MQGYFAHFGSKDSDGDITVKGAFKKTITERGPGSRQLRIRHLKNHQPGEPVGILTELVEDSTGLLYTSKLLKGDNAHGDYTLHLASLNYPFEHSFGYDTLDQDKKSDANYLKELKLWEGSTLTGWGANALTPMVGLKEISDPVAALVEVKAILEKALKTGNISDAAYLKIQSEYNSISQLLKTYAPTQPDDSTAPEETDYSDFAARLKHAFSQPLIK